MEDTERLSTIFLNCRDLLRKEGIPAAEKIKGPVVNHRVRSRFGRCMKTASGYEIEVSSRVLACDVKQVETILLHELLHTCPNCMNHGVQWKQYAKQLNGKYGYRITSRTSYETLGIEDPGSRETIKYLVVCTGCGLEIQRKRRCRLTEHPEQYRCGKCGGTLEIR